MKLLLNISISLPMASAAAAHLAERQFRHLLSTLKKNLVSKISIRHMYKTVGAALTYLYFSI